MGRPCGPCVDIEPERVRPLRAAARQYHLARPDAIRGAQFPLEADYATLQHTWTISPSVVNSLRAGFTRNSIFTANEGAALGEILPEIGIAQYARFARHNGIGLTGYTGFGRSAGNLGNIDNSYQLDDGIYWSRRSHSVQMGASLRYRRTWQQNSNANALGSLTFQPQFSAQLSRNAQGQLVPQAGTGDSFADFLLGSAMSGQVIGLPLIAVSVHAGESVHPGHLEGDSLIHAELRHRVVCQHNPRSGWVCREQYPHGFDEQTGLLQYGRSGRSPEGATAELA